MSKLICPIRGTLNVEEYDKSGLNFTEEKQRIDLVKILLAKKYPRDSFKFEEIIPLGSGSGKNEKDHLRIDLSIIVNGKHLIVCEVKKNNQDIKKAIDNQLLPAMKLKDAKYGIFYDGNNRQLFYNDSEYPLIELPEYGNEWQQKVKTIDSLQKINSVEYIMEKLDQMCHNAGTSKEERHEGIFQILLTKYYDEQFNKHSLEFDSANFTIQRFCQLFSKAIEYYSKSISNIVKLEKTLIFAQTNQMNILRDIVAFVSPYTFLYSSSDVIQKFFMKFGSTLLKKDLNQYYTPLSIVNFCSSALKIKPTDFAIDPASGSGDFMASIIQKYKDNIDYKDFKNNIFCWDCSKEAVKVCFLNMILNGDGRTNIYVRDSITDFNIDNQKFNFVLTNPPFGSKTLYTGSKKILEEYSIFNNEDEKDKQQLGILFIERVYNLLSNNGIGIMILPSGYMNNESQSFIRKWLINKTQIIADISLPEGVFKGASTGVKTDLLIFKKINTKLLDYPIFIDVVNRVGFDYTTKNLTEIFKINPNNGDFILDSQNERIIDNDLEDISLKLKQFAYDNCIEGLEAENNNIKYESVKLSTIVDRNQYLQFKPEFYLKDFQTIYNNNDFQSLSQYKLQTKISISNTSKEKLNIIKSENYPYIDIKNAFSCNYSLKNIKKGWELEKIDRCKQKAEKNAIYISYLLGSYDKFFYFNDDIDCFVTSGLYKIAIEDKKIRYSFLKFLFSNDYKKQFEALSTGHIQTNITINAIWNFRFPLITDADMKEIDKLLNSIKIFDNAIDNIKR